MITITIIEDEAIIRGSLLRLLTKQGYKVQDFETIRAAKEANAIDSVDLIISDVRLPGDLGTTLLKTTKTPVLIMTSYASLKSAVQIMKEGAIDYIAKPFDNAEMLKAVKAATQSTAVTEEQTKTKGQLKSKITGKTELIQKLIQEVHQVAPTEINVLITGEAGTGRRLISKAIHELSYHHNEPLTILSCAGLTRDFLSSVDEGTLVLDEIEKLSPVNQRLLLDFLRDRDVQGLQSGKKLRFIAAAEDDLKALVDRKAFLSDLYFHINAFGIFVAPLRDRAEDIPELANYILLKQASDMGRPAARLSKQAVDKLMAHSWPGNVRELENVIKKALITTESNIIDAEKITLDRPTNSRPKANASFVDELEDSDLNAKDQFFVQFVRKHEVSLSETALAEKLGISRKNLWERRQKLGIPRKK